jgi:hypothetical protein
MKKIIITIAIILVATISSSKVRGGKGGSVIQSSIGVGLPVYGGNWGYPRWRGNNYWGVGAPLYNNWGGFPGFYNGWGNRFGVGVGAGVFDQGLKGGVGLGVFDQGTKGGVGLGVFDQNQNQGIPIPVPVTPTVPDKGTVVPSKDTTTIVA